MSGVVSMKWIGPHQGKWHLLLVLRVWEELDSAMTIVQKGRSRRWQVDNRPIDQQLVCTRNGDARVRALG